ncbi:DNA repair protein REV1 isoform X3 [Rhododendron vialii]|uniref:DNA repair protein REV1 isoform X3 n=1 Tax=Rhododendron vialii TaxID=182163 RepID=UPI00265FF566|nr:DNA repair protein REV1 isoform X3 [Rhododendron vialii]
MSFNSSRSADSGSKSKRSFNSTTSNRSSNPSSNSDSSKKQKKTTQKTLGMAWGSNSRSASRSSFRNSPFSDFGSYMAVKNQKLQEQFEAEATSSSNSGSNSGKPIFQGVSIFVDGFTIPSSQELKGYMLKHGGRFENYFSRHRVTHIICSNLPDSKIKNLRSFSAGLPVVKPAWLLDSVAANKLLSWVPYELEQVASETHNQPKLSSFFALKSSALSNDPTTCVTGQVNSEIEDPSLIGGTIKESDLSGRCGYTEHLRPCSRESRDWDDSVHGNSTSVKIGEATCNDGECSEGNVAEPSNGLPIDKGSVDDRDPGSPSGPSASVISDNANKSTSSAIAGPSKRHHSTLVDPNFVENYFKKSRLHFIGTWRSRYRKRFPSSIYTSSNVNASGQRTNVIHVDMDCFFVSVVIRNHPELQDNPVAVCHSDNPRGTAEISSANYPARSYGVRAGIFVRDAKALCPHLTIFPYDFGAYEEVADQFYNILHKHCKKVQAVSCDEAFLEVRDFEVEDPQFLASVIRKEIVETTGCTASAGISGNLLMARLATKAAKPDGQCYIPPEKVDDYLNELPIKSLPGIGHVLEEKLKRKQIQTCGQLRMISKESLQKEFGVKTGDMLWNHSRGVDNRLVGVIQESKSVGAEVNWGVRFNDMKDCQHFLTNLCKEVSLRLQGCAVEGRSFTLKIKKRRSDAEEPVKYMGCGDCENLSHSMTVPMATDDVDIIRRITTQLFGSFHIDVKDIRGMGLQVSKLESVDTAKQGNERNSIRSWLSSASASTKELLEISSPAKESASREIDEQHIDESIGRLSSDFMGPSVQIGTNPSNYEAPLNHDLTLPALGDLDLGVVASLPPDVFSEINDIYDGKLMNLISKRKGKSVAQERVQVPLKEGSGTFYHHPACVNENRVVDKEEKYPLDKILPGPSNMGISTEVSNKLDLMPSSLSQVDTSVLQQLPEELRVDILQLLPAHRQPECVSDVNLDPSSKSKELLGLKSPENQPSVSGKELWAGNPPEWVTMFKHSNCCIFRTLADMYYRSGSTGRLSSILQCTLSESQPLVDASNDGWDDAIRCLCDLLKQYIKLRVETDIEEIYVSFRLLKRFTIKSKLFSQVYNVVFPQLQASVGENYGGRLHISDGKDL